MARLPLRSPARHESRPLLRSVRKFLSKRLGEELVVTERPEHDQRNDKAVEEVWRSQSYGYVVEHTRVEAFEGQIRDDQAFNRLVEPIEQVLAGALPGRFSARLPWGVASDSGIGFDVAREEIAKLVLQHAPRMTDGESVVLRSDRLSYEIGLIKRNSKDSRILFGRVIESDKTELTVGEDGIGTGERVRRIRRALEQKTPKLLASSAAYKLPSALILESNDFALSDVFQVAQAFKSAIVGLSQLPELVFLIETDTLVCGRLLKDGGTLLPHGNYFDHDGVEHP